jgi:hypothetical protein
VGAWYFEGFVGWGMFGFEYWFWDLLIIDWEK